MGPTTKTLSVTGGVTFQELVDSYEEQAVALIDGKVDVLLLETSQDTLNVKAGSIGIRNAFEKTGITLPVMISEQLNQWVLHWRVRILKHFISH